MLHLKWKLTLTYLGLAGLTLFLAGVGVMVETRGEVAATLIAILLTAMALTLPLVYWLARNFGRRIDELNHGTKALISGLGMPRGFNDLGDELSELGDNIYLVTRKLHSTIREISRESNKMSAILTSMLEGVVALDHIGRIVVLNHSAEVMFGTAESQIKGRYITDLIRDLEFETGMQRVLEKGESVRCELALAGRILQVQMSPVTAAQSIQGAVAVFQDITEIRRLEQVRTEFVANVSHELRTPLTSIKGFVETLMDGADADARVRERFLQIIHGETARLQRLIEDLLALANLENRRSKGGEPASAANAYSKIDQVLIPLAAAKNILLKVSIAKDTETIAIGEEMLSQVLLNLMENAIKYTPTGGKVWLDVESLGEQAEITVGDTGVGIPEESLPRVFERFYRVDKARSRELGGTGLGLSIVKHIVEQAKGKLQITSELGKGTVVKVYLPVVPEITGQLGQGG